jgi:V/A-type H+/Na+-transporting ATPase subunit K
MMDKFRFLDTLGHLKKHVNIKFSWSWCIIGVAFTILLTVPFILVLFNPKPLFAAAPESSGTQNVIDWGTAIKYGLGYLAIAISTGLAAVGAGIGTGIVGAAAVGVLAEKPDLFGRVLIFVGLAEGVAIYGLVMGIMILTQLK